MTNEIKQMVDELPTFTRMSEFREYVPKDKVIALVEKLTKTNEEAISNAWNEGYESGYNCACDGSTVSF